jgi:hypothetical protein
MDKTTLIIATLSMGLVVFFGQFLIAIYFPLFKGKGVRGRWIFIFAAPILTASIVLTGYFFIALPMGLAAVFLVPALKQAFNFSPYWIAFPYWVSSYWRFVAWFIWGVLGIVVCRFLWPRWPALLAVLLSDNGSNHL